MKQHFVGLAIGLSFGILDCVLFAMAGPIGLVDIASALTVWTMIGWAIHASAEMPFPHVLKGLLLTWAFNVPWVLEFVVAHKMSDLLLPMIIVATVFGLAMGVISQKLRAHGGQRVQGTSG
ncbi:hypothetical protein ABLO27_11490 [Roseibium sp. SCPC15]|uniref:hypothetical protein n=1 Tax=Roseibium sp. SCP15 TaxID=3141376 RepID=UPI00333D0EC8